MRRCAISRNILFNLCEKNDTKNENKNRWHNDRHGNEDKIEIELQIDRVDVDIAVQLARFRVLDERVDEQIAHVE